MPRGLSAAEHSLVVAYAHQLILNRPDEVEKRAAKAELVAAKLRLNIANGKHPSGKGIEPPTVEEREARAEKMMAGYLAKMARFEPPT